MKTTIKLSTLKAAVHCMAKKDIRSYLKGVNVLFKHGPVNRMEIVSTDTHVLSAFSDSLEYSEDPQSADFDLIIPDTTVKLAIKGAGKRWELTFESLPDGRYALGDVVFSPLNGKFPDYRRVIPRVGSSLSESVLQFDAELLLKAQNAIRDYFNSPKMMPVLSHMIGCGVVHNGTNQAVAVVMPIRDQDLTYEGFFKA